jgi:modification target Cys-rich repeat protein
VVEPAALGTAAASLEQVSVEMEARLGAVCELMVSHNSLPVGPRGLLACEQAAAGVEAIIVELFPPGIRITLAGGPSRCRVDAGAAGACASGCDGSPVTPLCEDEETGECGGRCTGVCTGSCGDRCTGICAGDCLGTCDGLCNGICERPCAVMDFQGRCIDACTGECSGTCDGTCDGSCPGHCTSACDGSCTGECAGSCDVAWTPGCDGPVRLPEASPACRAACELAAVALAPCSEPQGGFRGPEIEPGDPHNRVDAMIFSVGTARPALLSLRARLALIDATFPAFRVELGAADRACARRADRSIARLERVRAALDVLDRAIAFRR